MRTRVLISVGTHEQAFQRMLDGVAAALPLFPDVKFVVQHGVGVWPADLGAESVDYFTHREMKHQLEAADILISQASPGNVFGALEAGAWPLVLGRRKQLNEHVDDHQIHFATAVEEMGLGINLRDVNLLPQKLASELASTGEQRMKKCRRATAESSKRASAFHFEFWKNVDALVGSDRV